MAKLVLGNNKQNGVPAVVVPIGDIVYYLDVNGALRADPVNPDFSLPNNCQTTNYMLKALFEGSDKIKTVDLSNVYNVSDAGRMCYNCSNLEKFVFPTGSGDGFHLSKEAFKNVCCNCVKLKTVLGLENIVVINNINSLQNAFDDCTELDQVISFSSVSNCSGQQTLMMCFANTKVPAIYFPALTPSSFGSKTNQFNYMLSGVTGCVVHFPSNIQATIGSWADVVNGFGGTNTTVLFDLPSTANIVGANSITYERNPKYDTATALAWRQAYTGVNAAPKFYTSGTSDPTVGTTIYSDAECQTSVTTVTAIA